MFNEYRDATVIPNEFDDFRIPGSTGDLLHSKLFAHAFKTKSSIRFDEIKRYLIPYFIRGITPN